MKSTIKDQFSHFSLLITRSYTAILYNSFTPRSLHLRDSPSHVRSLLPPFAPRLTIPGDADSRSQAADYFVWAEAAAVVEYFVWEEVEPSDAELEQFVAIAADVSGHLHLPSHIAVVVDCRLRHGHHHWPW